MMNIDELRQLVAGGESESLEFKKSTGDLKGGMESLCGFLNGRGGAVLFGVSASGAIRGQTVSDNTLQDIANEIMRIEPAVTIEQSRVGVDDDREVIVLETGNLPGGPCTYHGRPFRRIGTTTSLMPQAEYQRRLIEGGHAQNRWETQPAEGYTLGDLDEDEVQRTIREAVDAGRLESAVTGPHEALRRLNLLDGDHLVRAAVVVFGKEVLPGFPQCSLRMARFRGTTKEEFLDQRQLSGHAFRLLEEATVFLRRHLPVRGRFEPGVFERQDEPLFPTLALREALVNALCHRDYSIAGGAVSVASYDDRMEIASTGGLPFGLTVDDLKREHSSRPRNPLIAEVFYRRGLIERWGRGTQRIVELCVQAGHPEPEFEERAGEVVVRFIPSGWSPPHRISHDLTDRQRRVLHALRGGQKLRLDEIRQVVDPNLGKSTLRDDLNLLRSYGLVESGGHGRGAGWWLKRQEEEK